MKTRAFTMLEIIIVIVTIGLLTIGILSYIRDDENTVRYKAEACLNKIQAEVTNYAHAALTSKKIAEKFPEQYIIDFNTNSNKALFKYKEKSIRDTEEYKEIDFSRVC